MGALLLSSTSVFVSCKDYDDDINSLSTRTTALEDAKVELEKKISDLRAELASTYATKAELEAAQNELDAVQEKLDAVNASVAALEVRLATAEQAKANLEALIGGALDGELAGLTYKDALLKTWAEIKSVDIALGERLSTLESALDVNNPQSFISLYMQNLQNQLDVLNSYVSDLKEGDKAATVAYVQELLTTAQGYTDSQIATLDIPALRSNLNNVSAQVDALEANLNVMSLASRQLRALVFRPKGYVDGVEAVKMLTLEYWRFHKYTLDNWTDLGGANLGWNKKEGKYNEGTGYPKNADVEDGSADRNDDHDRYAREVSGSQIKKLTRTLEFTADYHLNPSSADLSNITKEDVTPVSEDKWFESTRATAPAGFFTKGIIKPGETGGEAGILKVQYGLTDPTKLATGNMITVFATQLKYKGAEGAADTIITSDYATVINENIDSLVLSHAPKSVAPSLRVGVGTLAYNEPIRNTHCGECDLDANRKNMHLFATITEAAGSGTEAKVDDMFAPQDSIAYNSDGLDLTKLVETHYTDKATHKHKLLTDIAGYGLEYKFELTYLRYGSNLTSESAHAVIVEKEGKPYLIPWMPTNENREGQQAAYDETKKEQHQTKQLVGRTPLVRVSLVDTATGDVIDYGYIRFLIVDNDEDPVIPTDDYRRFIEYTGKDWSVNVPWTYTNNCGAAWPGGPYDFTTTWIETELDLYQLAGVSKEDFDQNWKAVYKTGNSGPLKQYTVGTRKNDAKPMQAIFTEATKDKGTVVVRPNGASSESDVLNWSMTIDEAREIFYEANPRPESVTIAVRYMYDPDGDGKSDNVAKDIYVVFNTGKITVTEDPAITGKVNWDGRKNRNYWYAANSSVENSGLVEVHANVYSREDYQSTQAERLAQTLQATFIGNKIADLTNAADMKQFITLANAPASLKETDLTLSLKFTNTDENGNGLPKAFKGYYDDKLRTYITKVSADGNTLLAFWDKNNNGVQDADTDEQHEEVIALLTDGNGNAPADINHVDVVLCHTAYAESMLNYAAHDQLENDVLTAYVTIVAKYNACDIPLTCVPMHVRFLRPINVKSVPQELVDASSTGEQMVDLLKLVSFTDWRDVAFKSDYWYYYNIKSIEVVGTDISIPTGQNISNRTLTNMSLAPGSEPTAILSEISNLVEFYVEYPSSYAGIPTTGTPASGTYGKIVYKNLGSTVQEFKVRIPVKITYEWGGVKSHTGYNNSPAHGALFTTVDIDVKKTQGNARQQ